jgi:hypothetical protein
VIISVETQPVQKESPMIVSASQDGVVFLWTLNAMAVPDEEDMLQFQAEISVEDPLTKAKWLSENQLALTTVTGKIYLA